MGEMKNINNFPTLPHGSVASFAPSVLPQWVLWKMKPKENGRSTKLPFNPHHTSELASVQRATTWGSYQQASALMSEGFDGTGFVLTEQDPYSVIDLDNCRDPQTGITAPWALSIVELFKSFTEVSPSGTGLHIWLKGKLRGGGRRSGQIEVYSDHRYIAFTGDLLPGLPATIEDRQQTLDAWLPEVFPSRTLPRRMERTQWGVQASKKPTSRFPQRSDEEVLRKAEQAPNGARFRNLYHDGDLAPYDGDHSRADQALCGLLAYWTNDDAEQIDRLFRRSALMRSKWDEMRGELTYGGKTIQVAIEGRL